MHQVGIWTLVVTLGAALTGPAFAMNLVTGAEEIGWVEFLIGESVAAALLAVGLIILALRRIWLGSYDPNTEIPIETRLARGRKWAAVPGAVTPQTAPTFTVIDMNQPEHE
jgi:hypothetical protein